MFDFIKKFFSVENEYGTGALIDDPVSKSDDIKHKDVFGGSEVILLDKPKENWRKFPVRNQGRGFSCMANACAKMLGILSYLRDGEFINFSAAHIYQRRMNKPNPGMFLHDVLGIASKGVTLEALVKSEQLLDDVIDNIKIEPHETKIGEIFATEDIPVYIQPGDFNSVASVVQTGKGVLCMFYFQADEWSKFYPTITNQRLDSANALKHGVVAIDAFRYNGSDVLLIEDSAHFGGFSQRIISKQFFLKRNLANGYLMQFKFDKGNGERPVFEDTNISLQKCLQFEGLFPQEAKFVENYGPLTKRAVIEFQKKYNIEPSAGVFGEKTKKKIAELYPKK